jgi:hypothetical protein
MARVSETGERSLVPASRYRNRSTLRQRSLAEFTGERVRSIRDREQRSAALSGTSYDAIVAACNDKCMGPPHQLTARQDQINAATGTGHVSTSERTDLTGGFRGSSDMRSRIPPYSTVPPATPAHQRNKQPPAHKWIGEPASRTEQATEHPGLLSRDGHALSERRIKPANRIAQWNQAARPGELFL